MSDVVTIDEFIDNLPTEEKKIARRLRMIILNTDPKIREQFSYKVPYFFRKRRVCYIWPASSAYGPKDARVILGFCYGNMLSNDMGYLLAEGRKQVYLIKYNDQKEVDEKIIGPILHEACIVDDMLFSKTK